MDTSPLLPELTFTATRSSGPGGQNVNKVNSKVTLRFDVVNSKVLSDEQREIILRKMASRLTKDGVLVIDAQEKRSQFQNKAAAIEKLGTLLTIAFTKKKKRRPTKPSLSSKLKRVEGKKKQSEKKQWRKKM